MLILLLRSEAVQSYLGHTIGHAISQKIDSEATIGRVEIGLFNRVILDEVTILDQSGDSLLNASRMAVNVNILPLLQGKISISAAQLFGPRIHLSRQNADAPLNCQYVFDALSSNDTTRQSSLDLSLRSLIIRRGLLTYDQLDAPKPDATPFQHVRLKDISAHLMLNRLCADSLDLHLKRLSFKQDEGPSVNLLSLRLKATPQEAQVSNLTFQTDLSELHLQARAKYNLKDSVNGPLILLQAEIDQTNITPSELRYYIPSLKNFKETISISSDLTYEPSKELRIDRLTATTKDGLAINLKGTIDDTEDSNSDIDCQLSVSQDFLASLQSSGINIPSPLLGAGQIEWKGAIDGSINNQTMTVNGLLSSSCGDIQTAFVKKQKKLEGQLSTKTFHLGQLLDYKALGNISGTVNLHALMSGDKLVDLTAKADVDKLEYKGYSYQGISADTRLSSLSADGHVNLNLHVNDPNLGAELQGTTQLSAQAPLRATARVSQFKPAALGLTEQWDDANFTFDVAADLSHLSSAKGLPIGTADLKSFTMTQRVDSVNTSTYFLRRLHVDSATEGLALRSDFGDIDMKGEFDYHTISSSISNLLAAHLPTLPGLKPSKHKPVNDFTLQARISDTRWLQRLFNFPVNVYQPTFIQATVNDREHEYHAHVHMPSFTYKGAYYEDAFLNIRQEKQASADTLKADISLKKIGDNGRPQEWLVNAFAADNHLKADLMLTDEGVRRLKGELHTDTHFYTDDKGNDAAQMVIHPSIISIDDINWYLQPSDIIYSQGRLVVDHVAIENGPQHIIINGVGTESPEDTITVSLQGVDVAYILDLVDFHSVAFAGTASGQASVSSLFQTPEASASLRVDDFLFQSGRMGTLYANARLNNEDKQIDLSANAEDEGARTRINGFISPQRNFIDLNIEAYDTRLEFLESFCETFMDDVLTRGKGWVRVVGDLKHINLEGLMVADGPLTITPLNTTYMLANDTVRLIPNEIIFQGDTVREIKHPKTPTGGYAVVTGAVHHQELKHITYDINVLARNILAVDMPPAEDSFYTKAFASGTCTISGGPGMCNIDAEVTPERGSSVCYNAASPDAITDQEFVKWEESPAADQHLTGSLLYRDNNTRTENTPATSSTKSAGNLSSSGKTSDTASGNVSPSDLHLNLIVHATPESQLRIIMDNATGDDITLYGSGALRAHYYNNGGFDLYGNYLVDHGTYKLTIQNVIKKDFQFLSGSNIAFRGEPFDATLNLNAKYTVNGVPISDLQLGRSFTSNNIRVDCQMNITGTPLSPHVDFSLDLPTIGNDAKQMIYSLINSEEEMNQQVLYLLAIGRFYNQGANNADAASQQSQTSLAMQSLLSGTISQQINNILSSMVNNQNWNFGASITTGDDGFYNAEYEGLLQGRMLNNRLLFDGQFGYRDNANTTSSFIGDFDLRYLLTPNGSVAVRVYNQTNDRYFTPTSLNTQGLGLILKKDFRTLTDLFGIKKKPKPTVEEGE